MNECHHSCVLRCRPFLSILFSLSLSPSLNHAYKHSLFLLSENHCLPHVREASNVARLFVYFEQVSHSLIQTRSSDDDDGSQTVIVFSIFTQTLRLVVHCAVPPPWCTTTAIDNIIIIITIVYSSIESNMFKPAAVNV